MAKKLVLFRVSPADVPPCPLPITGLQLHVRFLFDHWRTAAFWNFIPVFSGVILGGKFEGLWQASDAVFICCINVTMSSVSNLVFEDWYNWTCMWNRTFKEWRVLILLLVYGQCMLMRLAVWFKRLCIVFDGINLSYQSETMHEIERLRFCVPCAAWQVTLTNFEGAPSFSCMRVPHFQSMSAGHLCLWLKMIVYQAWRHTDFSLMFAIWTQHCKYVASFLPSPATTSRTATTKRTAAAAASTTTAAAAAAAATTTTTTVTYLRVPPVFHCCGSTLDFEYYSPECWC